jgi:[CysO sulfur-carrier protein]-S-L-cysteine hydrolase
MSILRLTESQYLTIVGNCYDGLPDEACGLLVGPLSAHGVSTGAITEAYPCRNADASARTYTFDPRDMLAAARAA